MGRDLDRRCLIGIGRIRVAISYDPFGGFLSCFNRIRGHERANRRNAPGLVGHELRDDPAARSCRE
jgi:hypothetical protein